MHNLSNCKYHWLLRLYYMFWLKTHSLPCSGKKTKKCNTHIQSSLLCCPHSVRRNTPESNFSAPGISFPRISGPKTRLLSANHARQTAAVCRPCNKWKISLGEKKNHNSLLCSSEADRWCALSAADGWMDVLNTQTAPGEECVCPCGNPPRRRAADLGRQERRRGGSSGARVSGCCFDPDEKSESATCQWSR